MRTTLTLVAAAVTGCAADRPARELDCREDRCEAVASRDELLGALDGFADPMAQWLRNAATERGTIEGDYRTILDGAGAALGCDATTEHSFVVLSNDRFIPKPIFARCTNDATRASELMMAMVGTDDGIDRHQVHVASWDATAGAYRRYQTRITDGGELSINVQPNFCLGCHGGPEQLAAWVPLMNEMTNPWSGWNAAPGFASQLFDDQLPAHYAADPTFREVTQPGVLDSAAAFEPIVRAGIARVTQARLLERNHQAEVNRALELVRPLFCDEGINYVSEVHDSGELRTHAVVDDALRNLFHVAGVDGGWMWLRDARLRLADPTATPLTLMPVRGEATIAAELGLVTRGALDARTVMRVRALDWHHPTHSKLRCELFRSGSERIARDGFDVAAAATIAELLPRLVDELLRIDGRPIASANELVAVGDADDPAAKAAIASGDWSAFATTIAGFGAAIEARVASIDRATLSAERNRLACSVGSDPTAPLQLDVTCP